MPVELVDSLNKSQVALLDQIQELHASSDVSLGYGYYQPQVRFAELLLGFLVALFHALGKFKLFVGRKQRHLSYLLEVHADRVVDGHVLFDVLESVFLGILYYVLELLLIRVKIQQVVEILFRDRAGNFHTGRLQSLYYRIPAALVQIVFAHELVYLVLAYDSVLLGLFQERGKLFHLLVVIKIECHQFSPLFLIINCCFSISSLFMYS